MRSAAARATYTSRSPCARASAPRTRAYVGKSRTASVSATAVTASAAILSRTGKRDAAARRRGAEIGGGVRERDAQRGAKLRCAPRERRLLCFVVQMPRTSLRVLGGVQIPRLAALARDDRGRCARSG